ncbi:MAG: (2Fe-2S) ferredoxin domain-containing protein [Bacillota bacterium]
MIEISVCFGSSCYLRGSARVVSAIQSYLAAEGIEASVTLKGSFCLDKCTDGVTVQARGRVFTRVTPETVNDVLREVFADGAVDHDHRSSV